MAAFTDSVVIDRTPDEVFAFISDFDNLPQWVEGVKDVRPLTAGGVRPGARFREKRQMGGRTGEADIEIIEHHGPPNHDEPPYRHVARGRLMGLEATYSYTFSRADGEDRTRANLHAEVKAAKLTAKPLVGVAMKQIRETDGDQLTRLKQAIERG
jgi:uncharacterized protein YndB with AHSA1/START domain